MTRRARLIVGAALTLAVSGPLVATAQQAPPGVSAGSTAQTVSRSTQPAAAKPSSLLPLSATQVLTHLRRSVSWYRSLSTVEQISLPGVSALARSQLQAQALTALRKAFEFGKAAEVILGRQQQAQGASHPGGGTTAAAQGAAPPVPVELERAAAQLSNREAVLKSQLAASDDQLRHVTGAKARASIAAERAGIAAALQLVEQIESNVDQLRRFEESSIAEQGQPPTGLRQQLAQLEKSIPDLAAAAAPEAGAAAAAQGAGHAASATAAASSPSANFQPQSAGVLALIGQWFTLHGYRSQLETARRDTTALASELTDTRSRLLAEVRQLAGSGLATIAAGGSAQLAAQRQTIEAATGQLSELSSVLIPLAEQALTLRNAQSTLADWANTLRSEQSAIARYLGLRLGLLLAWVAVVLVISEIWRRATFRYLQDARRRRPFLVLRRVVVGVALVLIIIFGLVSQFGSIATYAGFVTAGLAVALQNVILAVVAYFFLIGRYGVRVGDRVTISGVTGRVVDVSLLRIYLMELSGPDLHSTGRMVVLSNAVLFQPTALFKQIPGAEYLWHSVTLTVVATADVEEAYSRLEAAANRVYDTYRAAIQRQHDLAQRFIEFETAAPTPEVRLRLTDNGLECTVRYPVVPDRSARIDQQMLEALRKAVEGDEQLKLVASGGMVLKSSEG